MQISKQVFIARPPDQVWEFLSDVPAVADCVPGFELKEEVEPGVYKGMFTVKVGPVTARLEGQGRLETDPEARKGSVEGKGVDRRGGSRATAKLQYGVTSADGGSSIDVLADVTLSGPLAQVGRTGIIEDIADRLTQEFVTELERRLSAAGEAPAAGEAAGEAAAVAPDEATSGSAKAEPPAPAVERSFDAGGALWSSLRGRLLSWLRRLFGRKA